MTTDELLETEETETITLFQATFTIEGTKPLLMHRPIGVDPSHSDTIKLKELTSIRKKTAEQHATISRLEWGMGLYFDDELGPFVPGHMLWKSIHEGAKLSRGGPSVLRAIIDLAGQDFPVLYQGPRKTLDSMWKDPRFRDVRNIKISGRNAVMRTRPRFDPWKLQGSFLFIGSQLDPNQLHQYFINAGAYQGLGDGRTIGMGRYSVNSFDVEEVEV